MTNNNFCYKYPRMLVTVDAVIFKINKNSVPELLLVKRLNPPFKGGYALPGGFPEMNELLVDAAKRELQEETGLTRVNLTQLFAFDGIDRDPRDRNISVAFWGTTTPDNATLHAGDDAEKANWFPIDSLPELAFDHALIIEMAKQKAKI